MITFDTPYKGVIRQAKNSSNIIIKLEDASIESSKIKKIASDYIKSLAITPLKNYTQIVASINTSTMLIASKTSDGYGLRLRFTNNTPVSNIKTKTTTNKYSLSSLPTKKESVGVSLSYYIVVSLLIIGIVIALVLKRKMIKKGIHPKKQESAWLFKANDTKTSSQNKSASAPTTQKESNEVSIRFQKKLDEQNSVVMLDFGAQSYLVLMGNGNILLDKFLDDKPVTQEDFESILKSRQEELEEYLQIESESSTLSATKEPLQAYKERAGSLAYNEFI